MYARDAIKAQMHHLRLPEYQRFSVVEGTGEVLVRPTISAWSNWFTWHPAEYPLKSGGSIERNEKNVERESGLHGVIGQGQGRQLFGRRSRGTWMPQDQWLLSRSWLPLTQGVQRCNCDTRQPRDFCERRAGWHSRSLKGWRSWPMIWSSSVASSTMILDLP